MYNVSSFLQETVGNDALKSEIVLEFCISLAEPEFCFCLS